MATMASTSTAPIPTATAPTIPTNNSGTTTAAPDPAAPPSWDEEHYISALARLESLQNRIDSLRLTVPTLVRVLASPHATPDALFREFQKASMGPSTALVSLKKALSEKETREIYDMAAAADLKGVSGPGKEVEAFF